MIHGFYQLLQQYQNEMLWLLLIIINFSLILVAFRIWGRVGLFAFAVLSTIIANIQVLKQVTLFGMPTAMGDISYIGIYLISDILSENYGKTMARKIVWLGIFSLLTSTILMHLSIKMAPNDYDQAQTSLRHIFEFFPRIILASITAFTISQSYDITAYQFWRRLYPDYKYIWLRNGFSTILSQTLDLAIFNIIAFYGIFPLSYIFKIFITAFILRTVISIIDTPFVYWSVKLKPKIREI
jgi:queuosine precursor transporter